MAEKNKVYGLILPKKAAASKPSSIRSSNIFGDDSDEEDNSKKGPVAPFATSSGPSKMKRQAQMDIDKALQEDPNIYEYDEVYDQLQANKPQVGFKGRDREAMDKKPKYIQGLLKAAEIKKKEDERRKERQVQKEREAEGEKYADKEKFVTSAYKQKMLEMQAEEEKERREAEFEALTDVTKQKDMSGFYRYLYKNTTGNEPLKEENSRDDSSSHIDTHVKEEPISPERVRGDSESEGGREGRKGDVLTSRHSPHSARNMRKGAADTDSSGSDVDGRPPRGTERKRKGKSRRSSSSSSFDAEGLSRSRSPPESKKVKQRRRIESRDRARSKSKSLSPNRPERRRNVAPRPAGQRERSVDRGGKRQRSESDDDRPEDKKDSSSNRPRNADISDSTPPFRKQSRPDAFQKDKENQPRSDSEDEIPTAKLNGDAKGDGDPLGTRSEGPARPSSKPAVDPARKIYPHHNTAEDIKEARKRYLQRKLARAKGELA